MMNKLKSRDIVILGTLIFILGCAAMGVPLTTNPQIKIRYAYSLIHEQNRPFPAESLIWEAIEIYKVRGDNYGLAQAYRAYGYFLISGAVSNWGYRSFKDKTVTFDNRLDKAIGYWNKAVELFEKVNNYDAVSNMYFEIGNLYYVNYGNKNKACDCFSKSIEAHKRFTKDNPCQKIILPEGVNSFEEYIQKSKEKVGCGK